MAPTPLGAIFFWILAEEKINIARKMLLNELDPELISSVTGLSLEEISML